jgi:uncharacterized delta-60 repeat protein
MKILRRLLASATRGFASGGRKLVLPALVALTLLAFVATALSAAADRDVAFGNGEGFVTTDFGGSDDQAQAVAIQADGRIVVVGGRNIGADFDSDDFALARYSPDGSIDTSFGADGKVITDFGTNRDEARAVAIQDDGAIVVAGSNAVDFELARYLPTGALDPGFSGDGMLTTDLGGGDFVDDLAIQPDGAIVAVGGTSAHFALARYLPDGTLDASFSGDGKVTTDFSGGGSAATAVTLQSDGKIVVAGRGPCNPWCRDFALARYNPDGSLDATLDGDGKLTTDFGGDADAAHDLAIQADGKLIAAGRGALNVGSSSDGFAVARYHTDGSLDASFDGDGKTIVVEGIPGPDAASLALQPGGKILVGGGIWRGTDQGNYALARLNGDGSRDGTFSSDGWIEDDFAHRHDHLVGLALQSDGKIIAAGFSAELSATAASGDFAVVRYLADGGDTVPPETEIIEGPVEGSVTSLVRPTFAFTGRDNIDMGGQLAFACRLDGGPAMPCVSPIAPAELTEGRHRFEVAARDRAGNGDPTPASRTWTVDSTPPETTLALNGAAITRKRVASFAFTGTDRISASVSFECALDDGSIRSCSSPHVRSALADGRHRFTVRAIDQASNRDPSAAVVRWTVDTRPPTKPRVRGPRKTASRRPVYRFESADAIARASRLKFRCRVDSRRLRPCAAAQRLRLRPGKHTLFVAALDEAGNQSRVARTAIVVSKR